jgi:hypothetical protein
LVALAPDAIVATGISTVGPLLQLTRTIPIVFPAASDPVAAGLVESLARPGGNVTGFLSFEYSLSGKWPELLRQVAPRETRGASTSRSFDHLVGEREQPVRDFEAERLGSLEVEHQFELCRQHNRQIWRSCGVVITKSRGWVVSQFDVAAELFHFPQIGHPILD